MGDNDGRCEHVPFAGFVPAGGCAQEQGLAVVAAEGDGEDSVGAVSTLSRIFMPSAMRVAFWRTVFAIHTAPSTSSASPSGTIVAASIR